VQLGLPPALIKAWHKPSLLYFINIANMMFFLRKNFLFLVKGFLRKKFFYFFQGGKLPTIKKRMGRVINRVIHIIHTFCEKKGYFLATKKSGKGSK
jgi:hypothetical protein